MGIKHPLIQPKHHGFFVGSDREFPQSTGTKMSAEDPQFSFVAKDLTFVVEKPTLSKNIHWSAEVIIFPLGIQIAMTDPYVCMYV